MTDTPTPANEAAPTPSAEEEKLKKLYDQVPLLIALITEDNLNQGTAALSKLLGHFAKINELEQKLLPEGQSYTPLSLSRIYELATQGGGSADTQALKDANTAFAEENAILAETIESLTFQIRALKKSAADSLIIDGKIQKTPLATLKTATTTIAGTMAELQRQLGNVTVGADAGGKPLDERILSELSQINDISADLLKATPASTTVIGRILRRAGYAYDYKDIATVRQLIAAALKANRKLTDVIRTLTPAREQMEKLNHIIGILELCAGHEERKGPEYKEALEEIERLRAALTRYEKMNGDITEAEKKLQEKQNHFSRLETEIFEKHKDLSRLMAQQQEKEALLRQKADELNGFVQERARLSSANEILKTEVQILEGVLSEKNKRSEEKETQIKTLQQEAQLQAQKHQSDLAALRNKMRQVEGGLLIEKLEAEIATLRQAPEELNKKLTEEQEKRKAFEERVNLWVEKEEVLAKDLEKWKKRGRLRLAFGLAAASLGCVIGYTITGIALASGSTSLLPYYLSCIGTSAVVGTVIVAMSNEPDSALAGTAIGGLLGLMIAATGHGGMHLKYRSNAAELERMNALYEKASRSHLNAVQQLKAKETAQYNKMVHDFFSAHDGRVIQVVKDEKTGKYVGIDLGQKYGASVVTIDMTDPNSTKLSFPLTAPPVQKKETPASAAP